MRGLAQWVPAYARVWAISRSVRSAILQGATDKRGLLLHGEGQPREGVRARGGRSAARPLIDQDRQKRRRARLSDAVNGGSRTHPTRSGKSNNNQAARRVGAYKCTEGHVHDGTRNCMRQTAARARRHWLPDLVDD